MREIILIFRMKRRLPSQKLESELHRSGPQQGPDDAKKPKEAEQGSAPRHPYLLIFFIIQIFANVAFWWLTTVSEPKGPPPTVTPSSGSEAVEFVVEVADGRERVQNQRDHQLCRFLPKCFPSAHYTVRGDGEATFSGCLNEAPGLRQYYHSIYAIAKDPSHSRAGGSSSSLSSRSSSDGVVVGYVNIYAQRHAKHLRLLIYNVCVAPEWRRRGIATRMLQRSLLDRILEYEWREVYEPAGYGPADRPPVILALDVDWTDESAAESFGLYARLGFIRCMHPCKSIARDDAFKRLIGDAEAKSDIDNPLSILDDMGAGMEQAMWIKKSDKNDTGPLYPHFCMYRLYDDEWQTVGKRLQAYYSSHNN